MLQLSGASGLATAKLGDSSTVAVGDTVTGVGNAGGTGGTPSAATRNVTALNQSITASDEGGGNPENLTGMIEINADIQAGDSGGPLYAANGTIIGIDTAASSQSLRRHRRPGFAIPINKALSIAAADRVRQGHLDHPHRPAPRSSASSSAPDNTRSAAQRRHDLRCGRRIGAAQAGLSAGDTITAVNGQTVSSASASQSAMEGFKPGQQVTSAGRTAPARATPRRSRWDPDPADSTVARAATGTLLEGRRA